MAGKPVYWQDAHVRHNGATRFHVLLHIVDQERPVYENQWLVKVGGQTYILWDHEVKSRYLVAVPPVTEETTQPIQSEALTRFLENQKKAKKTEEPKAEDPKAVPLLDEFLDKGTIMQPETPAQEAAPEETPTETTETPAQEAAPE